MKFPNTVHFDLVPLKIRVIRTWITFLCRRRLFFANSSFCVAGKQQFYRFLFIYLPYLPNYISNLHGAMHPAFDLSGIKLDDPYLASSVAIVLSSYTVTGDNVLPTLVQQANKSTHQTECCKQLQTGTSNEFQYWRLLPQGPCENHVHCVTLLTLSNTTVCLISISLRATRTDRCRCNWFVAM